MVATQFIYLYAKEVMFNFLTGNMSNCFTKLATLDFHEIFDLVDIVQDNLDDLWKQDDHKPYPQVRMSHLMDTIGAAISRAIQVNLKGKVPNNVIFFLYI